MNLIIGATLIAIACWFAKKATKNMKDTDKETFLLVVYLVTFLAIVSTGIVIMLK